MNVALTTDSKIARMILTRYLDLHVHDITKDQATAIAQALHTLGNIEEEE